MVNTKVYPKLSGLNR